MTPMENSFNDKIAEFLKDSPNIQASETIRIVMNGTNREPFHVFDDKLLRLGIQFRFHQIIGKRDKILGYTYSVTFTPRNTIGEESHTYQWPDDQPLDMKSCGEQLAKYLVYRLNDIKDLDKLLAD